MVDEELQAVGDKNRSFHPDKRPKRATSMIGGSASSDGRVLGRRVGIVGWSHPRASSMSRRVGIVGWSHPRATSIRWAIDGGSASIFLIDNYLRWT
jgi:hypothetical protein